MPKCAPLPYELLPAARVWAGVLVCGEGGFSDGEGRSCRVCAGHGLPRVRGDDGYLYLGTSSTSPDEEDGGILHGLEKVPWDPPVLLKSPRGPTR